MSVTLDPHAIELQADKLVTKTRAYLITMLGCTLEEASSNEVYRALAYSVREEIMINWVATQRTMVQRDARTLYYLSMEYLPGRISQNNVSNLGITNAVRLALQKMNRNVLDIARCETDPGLGNGGLGRLAACLMDSLATHHYPAKAYGLRYEYGIFEQQIWNGVQIEAPDAWLLYENPWELRRDLKKVSVLYSGRAELSKNIHNDPIMTLSNFEEVWAVPFDIPIVGYNQQKDFSVLTLRLWTTKDSPHNFKIQGYNAGHLDIAAENTALTDVLYPNEHTELGKRVRLKQEFLLVSSSLQDIMRDYLKNHQNLRAFADKVRIQVNDTHPALIVAELMRILTAEHDLAWKTALEITQTCVSYTNHTILSEALEQWDAPLLRFLLPRQYQVIERLNQEFCNSVRVKRPNDEGLIQRMSIIQDQKVRMANLSIIGSHCVNGVAQLHTEILKKTLFKDFNEFYPNKFINITNGVTQRRWLLECNPELSQFISQRIGDKWITDLSALRDLAKFASDPDSQDEFMQIKRKNKVRCVDFLNRDNPIRDAVGVTVSSSALLEIDSFFDVQVKRIHEYKRQLMNILHVIMLYQEMVENPDNDRIKRTCIIGGKAAPGYQMAKEIIRLIWCVARKVNRDPQINNKLKIVFLENYNVSRAEIIIPATDLSEQISTAGMEASGTGNMKLALNGALTIGTRDGANIEMEDRIGKDYWLFPFGASADEIALMRKNNSYDPMQIYKNNPKIKKALDALTDGTFTETDEEKQIFLDVFNQLLKSNNGGTPDRYFTLYDLKTYYETQLKAEKLYQDPRKWAFYAMHNIAGMGDFSIDTSMKNYAAKVWNIQPCPIDKDILDRVRYEYRSYPSGL